MDFLKGLHQLSIAFDLYSTAFLFLVLTFWGFVYLLRPDAPTRGFLIYSRVLLVLTLFFSVTGTILALSGRRVPISTPGPGPGDSAVQLQSGAYYPVSPNRNAEHWMYTSFILLGLGLIEWLLSGRTFPRRVGARYVGVAALFAFGAAVQVVRVAIYPPYTPA